MNRTRKCMFMQMLPSYNSEHSLEKEKEDKGESNIKNTPKTNGKKDKLQLYLASMA